MNKQEMREILRADDDKILHDTWSEYSDDKPLPSNDRESIIEALLELMEKEGDLDVGQPFKLTDLARELGVNPKVARDKIRKAKEKPTPLEQNGWVFHDTDRAAIQEIIKPRRKA